MIRVRRPGCRHHCVILSAGETRSSEFCSMSYGSIVSFVGIEKGIGEVRRVQSQISNVGMLAEFVGMPTAHDFLLSNGDDLGGTL